MESPRLWTPRLRSIHLSEPNRKKCQDKVTGPVVRKEGWCLAGSGRWGQGCGTVEWGQLTWAVKNRST